MKKRAYTSRVKDDKKKMVKVLCFYCLKVKAVAIPTDKGTGSKVLDTKPCETCKNHLQDGVMLISIKSGQTRIPHIGMIPNPIRTGRTAVIYRDKIAEVLSSASVEPADDQAVAKILADGFAFIDDLAWENLGLPKGK